MKAVLLSFFEGFFRYLNYHFLWDFLKSFQSSKLIQSMSIWLFLTPLAAKFLSKIEEHIEFTLSNQVYILDLTLPFSWSVFFFSALLFTAANILYYIFAPVIIKDNDDYGSFLESGKGREHLEKYSSGNLNTELVYFLRNNSKGDRASVDPKEWFWKVYNIKNKENYHIRFTIVLFYLLGFVMLLCVVLQNILWVIKQLF